MLPATSDTAWYLWAPTEWAHPGAVPFPPQRTQKANVQCGLRRFPHEGFRWCWFTRTTLYLPPFQGVVPSPAQLDSWCRTLLWSDCTSSGGTCARTSTAGRPSRDPTSSQPSHPKVWEEVKEVMWWKAESKEHRRRSLQNFLRVHHSLFVD